MDTFQYLPMSVVIVSAKTFSPCFFEEKLIIKKTIKDKILLQLSKERSS